MENKESAIASCPYCGQSISKSDLIVCPETGDIVRGSHKIHLSCQRMDIFSVLYNRYPQIVELEYLMKSVHGKLIAEKRTSSSMRTQIYHLRKIIKKMGIKLVNKKLLGYGLIIEPTQEDHND